MQDLTDEQRAVLPRIQKLLQLADRKAGNEAEAASAVAKVQDLLLAYNLDAALLDQAGGSDTGKRADEKLRGGNYKYSRGLWSAVSDLNFCFYWSTQKAMIDRKRKKDPFTGELVWRDIHKIRWHHRLVGRTVNIAATKAMAEYLEETIERLVRERIGHQANLLFSKWAVSYRNGAAAKIREKIWDRRHEMIKEERIRAKEAAERAANDAARKGYSTSNAITISSAKKQEEDANNDFIYGAGTSARWAAERAARAAADLAAEQEYTRWAEAHPEEARKEAEKERKEADRREARRRNRPIRERYRAEKDDGVDYSAYNAGYEAGAGVSIDQQVGDRSSMKKIGRMK